MIDALAAVPDRDDAHAIAQRLPTLASSLHPAQSPRRTWSALATIGATDLTIARIVEPHVDALTILAEAPDSVDGAASHAWGVYAAEASGARLEAQPERGGWRVRGDKPWCSLARHLDRALVTAWTGHSTRRLFAIDLTDPSVAVQNSPWVARGLTAVDSPTITCSNTPAVPIGDNGWYFDRPGFGIGGIRVAAVWYGAAVALGATLQDAASRREFDQIGLMHLGAVDSDLHAAHCVLSDAEERVRDGISGRQALLLASRVRRQVRQSAESVLGRVAHALGPAPLARDEQHARRVADLTLYLRQEHAERDEAALGTAVTLGEGSVL